MKRPLPIVGRGDGGSGLLADLSAAAAAYSVLYGTDLLLTMFNLDVSAESLVSWNIVIELKNEQLEFLQIIIGFNFCELSEMRYGRMVKKDENGSNHNR